jgi:parallel beta-helix repeat protein
VAGEGRDCGEGIHISGVDHSSVSNNVVQGNAGGILISDDTGPTHDNLISGNLVQNNPYDCGITLASHHFAMKAEPLKGVYHNTVTGNTSSNNGLATAEGAGVGIFAGPPGGQNYGNVVVNNVATGNGMPGVALHSHAPFQNLNDNMIVGNQLSSNGPDSDPGTSVPTGIAIFSNTAGGAPPITGTVITQNVFAGHGIDVVVNAAGSVDVHFNAFSGFTGISNLGAGAVNATLNYWNCVNGPGVGACSKSAGDSVVATPWLNKPF